MKKSKSKVEQSNVLDSVDKYTIDFSEDEDTLLDGESDASMEVDDTGSELSGEEEEEDDDSEESLSDEEEKMSKILGTGDRFGEITEEKVEQWRRDLHEPKPLETFLTVSRALRASIKNQENSNRSSKEVSPDVFNKLVKVCLIHIPFALRKMLNIQNLSLMTSAKKFKKLSPAIKAYVQNLILLLDYITYSELKAVVLKRGILPLISIFKTQPEKAAEFVDDLIIIWSKGSRRPRVLAFLAIFRIVKQMNAEFLDVTLKNMYRAYTKNCMVTSQANIDCINVMRLSLSELFGLDKNLAYKHGFVNIPLLKSAVNNNNHKIVCNWQFVHCLHFWCTMLMANCPDNVLDPLVHPVIEVALLAMKLQPTPKFHPFILHIVSMLTELSVGTGVYIALLPFLMKVFTEIKPLKKTQDDKSISNRKKFPNWDCQLKINERYSAGYYDMKALLHMTMLKTVEYLAVVSNKISFPDIVVLAVFALKNCEKRKEPFCQSFIKQLLAKITLQCEYIEEKKKHITFDVKDAKKVADWEIERRQETTMPMLKFLKSLHLQYREAVQCNGKRKRED